MDFVADQLFDDQKFRVLTVVDNFSCKCLAIEVGQSLEGTDVAEALNQLTDAECIMLRRIEVDK